MKGLDEWGGGVTCTVCCVSRLVFFQETQELGGGDDGGQT